MTKAISFTPGNKEVKSIVEQIRKQQITVGGYLQNIILTEKEVEGTKVKNIREFMESQRNYVWETWRASNLIQSMLLNIFIPEVILYRADDKSQFRKVLDGNQRLTTTYLFVNDLFKLDLSKSIFPTFEIEGEQYTYESIQGKKFSELPELFRDAILNYDLRMTTCNNCDEEQAEKFFVSMNAGVKVLKPAEVRNAAMGMSTRRFFTEVLKSDWMLHCLTPKAITTNTGNEIVAQVITLMHNSSPIELSKENMDNVIYSYRDGGVPENMKNDIINVGEFLNDVTNIWIEDKKKQDELKVKGKKVSNYATYRFSFFNKTNTVMLMMAADQAIKANVSIEEFAKWSYKFFDNPSEDYKKGMTGKVNELQMVDFRMLAIQEEVGKLKKGETKQEVVKQEAAVVKTEQGATYKDIKSVLDEFKEVAVTLDNSPNIAENTNEETIDLQGFTGSEIVTKEEFHNDVANNAETLPETDDNVNEDTQKDDGIEIGELTIEEIPGDDEEPLEDQEQAS